MRSSVCSTGVTITIISFVTRAIDPNDRRVARVHVTVAGHRLLEQSRTRKNAFLAARIRTLPSDERAALSRAAEILERILEHEE